LIDNYGGGGRMRMMRAEDDDRWVREFLFMV
jgi:hypothetical protein